MGKTALVQMFCSGNTNFAKDYQMVSSRTSSRHRGNMPWSSASVMLLYQASKTAHGVAGR